MNNNYFSFSYAIKNWTHVRQEGTYDFCDYLIYNALARGYLSKHIRSCLRHKLVTAGTKTTLSLTFYI